MRDFLMIPVRCFALSEKDVSGKGKRPFRKGSPKQAHNTYSSIPHRAIPHKQLTSLEGKWRIRTSSFI